MNTTTIKERGFVAYQHEVRAFLAGRQSQFRRIVKLADSWDVFPNHAGECWPVRKRDNQLRRMPCPYGSVGDRLWVRETFCRSRNNTFYRADWSKLDCKPNELSEEWDWDSGCGGRWTPSIHMPRRYSRINLEITGVRVERLNEISEADANQEGVIFGTGKPMECRTCAKGAFMDLWESINGAGSWAANPWVWVVEVKRVEA